MSDYTNRIEFRETGDRILLHIRGSRLAISVERDEKCPSMWRVRMSDGSLTDMVNKTRAKDAALAFSDRCCREPQGRPPVRQNESAATHWPEGFAQMPSRRKNRWGRSNHGPSFVQLFRYMLESPAWQSLSHTAVAAYIELARQYNGCNNGRLALSTRTLAERRGCSNSTAARPDRAVREGLHRDRQAQRLQRQEPRGGRVSVSCISLRRDR
jgi:hypothetical protein